MKNTTAFFATLAAICCLSIAGIAQEDTCVLTKQIKYHDNGQIQFAGHSDCDGQWHGHFVEYHEDGSIYGIGEFSHGVKVGTWTTYPKYTSNTYIKEYDQGHLAKATILENDLVVEQRQYTR